MNGEANSPISTRVFSVEALSATEYSVFRINTVKENEMARTPVKTIFGTELDDLLSGTAANEKIYGRGGNDLISGGLGNDYMDGGSGIDTVTYSSAASAVTVDLSITSAQYTGATGFDTLISIENLVGSAFNDTLKGNSLANSLSGLSGMTHSMAELATTF
jgi:Ca2+-binding RTX toxin-like protein